MTAFILNQQPIETPLAANTVLLDIIRQQRGLMGTKEVCREGDCGACQVLLGRVEDGQLRYRAVNSCLLPLGTVSGGHVVTVEGLNTEHLNPIQHALVDQGAIQCGFCTPGLVMAITGFFLQSTNSDEHIAIDAVAGNLCRCTGYAGIKRAVKKLCAEFDLSRSPLMQRIEDLVKWQVLPDYFLSIAQKLPPAEAPRTGSVLIAGGTDLLLQKPDECRTHALHFLSSASDDIAIENNRVDIKATTTLEHIKTSPILHNLLPHIDQDFKLIASKPIRNQATLGGNLANASPIADLSVYFLALNADVHTTVRTLALKDFFLAYKKTDLKPSEQITSISFDSAATQTFSFEKVSMRQHLDIASVNTALSVQHKHGLISSAHLSAGGVSPIPLYLAKTSAYLQGKLISDETVLNILEWAQTEIAPISDIRGSAQYKRLLLRQLLLAHFLKLFPEALNWENLHAR